jgi:hypothetical protein
MSDACCPDEFIGAEPAQVKWRVVRGDTSSLEFQFLENDETTFLDLSDWTFSATAFNSKTNSADSLDVSVNDGAVTVTADANITETWGTGINQSISLELKFDLQATRISDGVVWTPAIGIIQVISDVTTNTLTS